MRQARDEWKVHRQPKMRDQVHRLVFLDETSTTTKMTRLRGRSCGGTRLKAGAPFGHWATQTFIAGLRSDGLVAPWVNEHVFMTLAEARRIVEAWCIDYNHASERPSGYVVEANRFC